MVTFERVSNGIFNVFYNNIKANYQIINGCLGSSGFGGNLYGITNLEANKTTWMGSLQKCKKSLIRHFEKNKQ